MFFLIRLKLSYEKVVCMQTMGEIIAQKRKEKGMTQADLALKMNVTDKAVSKWERNLACPDIYSLSPLADILGIPVSELLNAKNTTTPQADFQEIMEVIFKAVSLAMGVAVTVLAILGKIEMTNGFILLGIGLSCLTIDAFNNKKK